MMTLDEEITKLDLIASDAFEGGNANEFKQLAEWLKELKAYKEELPKKIKETKVRQSYALEANAKK